MLHLGRSPGGPSYGSSSRWFSQQQPHLYCAAKSLYLRRLLNRTHPLSCDKRHLVSCSTHKLHTCSGIHDPRLFVGRKMAVARAFVTQEIADKEEYEGEDESVPFVIPRELPWTINPSLAVHNWGTIYHGPLEAKYFNPSRDFPYPVGYMSVKAYKGKDYYQSIEEGPKGPVFVVKEAELGEVKAETPQKAWTSICKNGTIRVHGMRHFGFESSEVIRVLQSLDFQSKKFSRKDRQILPHRVDIASAADVPLPDAFATNINMEASSGNKQFSGAELVDEDTSCGDVSADELDVSDDIANDFLSIGIKDDLQYGEEDVSVDACTDVKDDGIISCVPHINVTIENETVDASADVLSDKRLEGPSMRRSASTHMKRSFKAGSRKYTFVRASRGIHEEMKQGLVKHDHVLDDGKDKRPVPTNVLSSNAYTSRQRTSQSAERQIWRKGEGLSGYIPGQNRQHEMQKVQVVGLGDSLRSVAPGCYRQQTSEKVRAEERVLGLDKECNDGKASSGYALESQDCLILEAKEEISESLKSLLELLNKWEGSKEQVSESGHKPQNRFLQMHRSLQEDVNLFNESNLKNERCLSVPDSGYASQAGVSLDNDESPIFNVLGSVDENTSFAVSKLFAADAKPHVLLDDGRSLSSGSRPPLNGVDTINQDIKSWKRANTSKHCENLDKDPTLVCASGPNNLAQVGTSLSNFSREPRDDIKIVEPSEERPDMTRWVANEARLIEDLRKLVVNQSFGNLLEKVKAMKLSGMLIKEDVYEAILGVELDSWQRQVFKQVQDGNSVLISAPSGVGKSAIADCCIFNNVVNEQRALFVTPYDHLATMNLRKFKSLLGESIVGESWTTTWMQECPKLLVITLKVLSEILHELNGPGGSQFRSFFDGVNMVVLDKFCTYSDAKYGRLWEEVLMFLDTNISVLALSLPATNEAQMASWLSLSRGPCELVSCKSVTVQKRYLFCRTDGLYPLLNPEGTQVNENLYKTRNGYVAKCQLESSLWSGCNRPSLTNMLTMLEFNALLPAIVLFLDVKSCDDLMQDVLSNEIDSLLSRKESEDVEAFLEKLKREHLEFSNYADRADDEALRRGFAVYHEGKMPLWGDIVVELFQKNLIKVLIMTDSSLLHSDFTARTLVISDVCKVRQNGVFSIELLQLVGRAGRRGCDIEGNIIFLESIHSAPKDVASLLLNNTISYVSCFKPSYFFVANLMAKHNLSEAKRIISCSFAAFQYFTEHTKTRKLKELDQEIFCCLERKAVLDSKLFEGLMAVNKHKLSNVPIFTRVDIRMAIHSLSQSGNVLPGILLTVVPSPRELFYMVFGVDNCFRLVPAGALDHVYANEVPPLDVFVKESTGHVLLPPLVPPKDSWRLDDVSSFGYIVSGNSHTKEYVKFMMQYPVQPSIAKEGLQLRKDIFVLEAQLSNLVEKRKLLQAETFSLDRKHLKCYAAEAATWQVDESEIWKEALRNLYVLEKVDALSIIDSVEAYAQLSPLGMLISMLHNFENELWLAVAMTSKYAKALSPAEFAGLLATVMPLDPERESLCTPGTELSYRVTKSLKEALAGVEVLRRQVATLQGSYSPPLEFDTAFAGLVCAWAQGKAATIGHYVMTSNDGDLAWRLKSVARLASLLGRACFQVSVYAADKSHYRSLSLLAKKVEEILIKHLMVLG